MNNEEIKFIDRLYRDLYLSEEVLHHSSSDKTDKYKNIKEYLDMLKNMHERASVSDNRKEILKRMYHDKYVIKSEDIPDSYYEHQKKIAFERGYGHIEIDDRVKREMDNQIITNQKKSLDVWLDYFLSDDAKMYPFWAKYWAFQGMLKLGTYDKENKSFNRRTKNTTSIFVDLNREALALSIDLIIKAINKETIDDKDLETLVKGGSFQRIYTYILNKILSNNDNIIKKNEGKWIKYDRGTDHMPLVNSLRGYNTGWCTAGESMAASQLAKGDFYVYYTIDGNGEYKVPRIAIRMEGSHIGEIRGIAQNQNLEPEMEDVVQEKIKDFPDKDKYYKKVNDMKQLTELYEKNTKNEDLSIDDLRFLYEVDNRIMGFGYQEDPRIQQIKFYRNEKEDIAKIFDCNLSQIAGPDDMIQPYTKVLYGNHYIDCDYVIPEAVFGHLYFSDSKMISNCTLPKLVTGNVNMEHIENLENVTLPQDIRGQIFFSDLKVMKNVTFPKRLDGSIQLYRTEKIENVVFPEVIGIDFHISHLDYGKNVILPKEIGGSFFVTFSSKIDNMVFPEKIGGCLSVGEVKEAYGVVLPKEMECAFFYYLEKAGKLEFPNKMYAIDLPRLRTIDTLILPEHIEEDLYLSNLSKVNKLVFPKSIKGDLYISKKMFLELGPDYLGKIVSGRINVVGLSKFQSMKYDPNVYAVRRTR